MKAKAPRKRGARPATNSNHRHPASREQERVIVELARSEALAGGDLDAAFRQIVKAAARTAKVARAGIWRYGRGRLVLRCIWQYDLARGRYTHGEELAATEFPEYFRALDSEVVIAAGQAMSDRRTRELAESYLGPHSIRSMLDAPILVGGRLWGVLCHETVSRARQWSTGDKLFARALADTAALAIEAARRREAAEALRRREAYFRSLLEAGCELVAVLNGDGKVLYLTPGTERILDRRTADVVGRTFFEFVHPHDVAQATEGLRRLKLIPGGSIGFQARLRRADGSWRHIEGTARNLIDDVAVGGIVAGGSDTTERRWAELKVRALLGVAQDIGGTLDLQVLLRRVHRRAIQVLSSSLAATFLTDAGGGTRIVAHEELAERIPEARQKLLHQLADRLERITAAGEPVALRSDDGAGGDILQALDLDGLALVSLNARGQRLGTFALGRRSPEPFDRRELALLSAIAKELAQGIDTAALYRRQREEAEFSSALLRVGYELLSATDPSSVLERVCALTVELLPCDFSRVIFIDEERRIGRVVAGCGETPEERDAVVRLTQAPGPAGLGLALLEREGVARRDAMMELADRFGWRAVTLVALRSAGRIVGTHSAGRRSGPSVFSAAEERLLRGIAQMTSLSLQTLMLVSRLEQANRVKSDFISMMSHELRTPLNIVLGYTGLLREKAYGAVNEEQDTALERVEQSAQGLLDLISTTLDLSQLERGNVAVAVSEVDVGALIAEVEAQSRTVLLKPSVRLRTEVPKDLPRLWTDAGKLRVVLQNLIANALRFTDEGEVRVRVRPWRDGIEISVADTGIGIAPESQEFIFEAFRQAESGTPVRKGGVGLGLYIVRRLLELLHGTVELDSSVGKGSTFRVWIPLVLSE